MSREFTELVNRVRRIDPLAAEYLLMHHPNTEVGDLSGVMLWSKTPQGHEYWRRIYALDSRQEPGLDDVEVRQHDEHIPATNKQHVDNKGRRNINK